MKRTSRFEKRDLGYHSTENKKSRLEQDKNEVYAQEQLDV